MCSVSQICPIVSIVVVPGTIYQYCAVNNDNVIAKHSFLHRVTECIVFVGGPVKLTNMFWYLWQGHAHTNKQVVFGGGGSNRISNQIDLPLNTPQLSPRVSQTRFSIRKWHQKLASWYLRYLAWQILQLELNEVQRTATQGFYKYRAYDNLKVKSKGKYPVCKVSYQNLFPCILQGYQEVYCQ